MVTDAAPAVAIPERLTAACYWYAQADRLARVPAGTSKRWTRGYTYLAADGTRVSMPPVSKAAPAPAPELSFAELLEVAAIHRLRECGLPLPAIRKIFTTCQDVFGSEHAMLSERFRAEGQAAFVQAVDDALAREPCGEKAWDKALGPFLEMLDYQDGWVRRWWPAGRSTQVVIDPDYGWGGRPVVAGTGVRTEILLEFSEAGETREEVVYNFGVSAESVKDALTYERSLTA